MKIWHVSFIALAAASGVQAQTLPQPQMSQEEQTLVTALQGQASSDSLVRSAVQVFATKKDERIKALEAENADLKKQIEAAKAPAEK